MTRRALLKKKIVQQSGIILEADIFCNFQEKKFDKKFVYFLKIIENNFIETL